MKTATVWNENEDLPSFNFPTARHLAAQVSHPTERIYHPRPKVGQKTVNAGRGGVLSPQLSYVQQIRYKNS